MCFVIGEIASRPPKNGGGGNMKKATADREPLRILGPAGGK